MAALNWRSLVCLLWNLLLVEHSSSFPVVGPIADMQPQTLCFYVAVSTAIFLLFFRYINHSCAPNCVAEVVTFERGYKIIISSVRRIEKGEEVRIFSLRAAGLRSSSNANCPPQPPLLPAVFRLPVWLCGGSAQDQLPLRSSRVQKVAQLREEENTWKRQI